MTTFTGNGFTIYSGTKGDIVVRPDGIWVEFRNEDTRKWTGFLGDALDKVGYVRHP